MMGPGEKETMEDVAAPAEAEGDGRPVEETEVIDAEDVEAVEEEAEPADPLAEAQARLRTVSKAYRDLQEEMNSFRVRMEARGKVKAERQAFDTVRAFFEPVQNLARSLESSKDDLDGLLQGLQLVHHQFDEALKGLGLEPIPGVGTPFDPNLHEALALQPVEDAAQDGVVLLVHAPGFMVRGKVLQAAQVVVGKLQEPSE